MTSWVVITSFHAPKAKVGFGNTKEPTRVYRYVLRMWYEQVQKSVFATKPSMDLESRV
jgi:hypothetical protein